MSDHRFELTVTFSIYGKDFDWDTSLNWNDWDSIEGCDPRIIEWFANCYEEARAAWDMDNARDEELKAERALEVRERSELARLKAKYEGAGMPYTIHRAIPGDAGASPEAGMPLDPGTYTAQEYFAPSYHRDIEDGKDF